MQTPPPAYPFGDPGDEVVTGARIGGDLLGDLGLKRSLEGVEVEQGLGVDADLPVDDELQSGQADAGVRQPGERKAWSGVPTFIMIFTGMSGIVSSSVDSTVKSKMPS